jgi:hypothetical protein
MLRAALASIVLLAACGGESEKTYDTYQLCFDDKTEKQKETVTDAIVRCCLDHDIMGTPKPVCGATQSDCINFLTSNLDQTDADISVQTPACQKYVTEKDMPE